MAFRIVASCVNCYACESVCPNGAVRAARPHFVIDAGKCTECLGDFDDAQCAAICPVEGAIVDAEGRAMNPPGSLSGVTPSRFNRWAMPVIAFRGVRISCDMLARKALLARFAVSAASRAAAIASLSTMACWISRA